MYCVYGNSGRYIHSGPLFGGGPLLGGSVIGGSILLSRKWYTCPRKYEYIFSWKPHSIYTVRPQIHYEQSPLVLQDFLSVVFDTV